MRKTRERPMIEEFKKFALRGNAVDLAIAVIIGAAFGAIVNSLVADIMSPIIGAVTGGFDFSNHFLPLSSKVSADSLVEAKKQGAVLAWGSFLTIVINFIIIAWVLFLVVKLMNQIMQSEAPKTPALTKQEMLLTEIRDLLKREPR
jgi:large conductance mechanosensitive channel